MRGTSSAASTTRRAAWRSARLCAEDAISPSALAGSAPAADVSDQTTARRRIGSRFAPRGAAAARGPSAKRSTPPPVEVARRGARRCSGVRPGGSSRSTPRVPARSSTRSGNSGMGRTSTSSLSADKARSKIGAPPVTTASAVASATTATEPLAVAGSTGATSSAAIASAPVKRAFAGLAASSDGSNGHRFVHRRRGCPSERLAVGVLDHHLTTRQARPRAPHRSAHGRPLLRSAARARPRSRLPRRGAPARAIHTGSGDDSPRGARVRMPVRRGRSGRPCAGRTAGATRGRRGRARAPRRGPSRDRSRRTRAAHFSPRRDRSSGARPTRPGPARRT